MDREINFSEIELCISYRIVASIFGVQVVSQDYIDFSLLLFIIK